MAGRGVDSCVGLLGVLAFDIGAAGGVGDTAGSSVWAAGRVGV